jgi:hypothetical protein
MFIERTGSVVYTAMQTEKESLDGYIDPLRTLFYFLNIEISSSGKATCSFYRIKAQ